MCRSPSPNLSFTLFILIFAIISGFFSGGFCSYTSDDQQNDDVSEEPPYILHRDPYFSFSDDGVGRISNIHRKVMRLEKVAQSPVAGSSPKIFNVDDYGAVGDDGKDDSQAFKEGWKEACSSKNGVLWVPSGKTYHLKPITFTGPCNSHLILQIDGTIKASPRISDYQKDMRHWLMFQNMNGFTVQGGGSINGNGRIWWLNSCKINKSLPCKDAPTAVTFYDSNNLKVEGLRFRNAQKMHISFQKCRNVKALNLWIYAPGNSPNTDGIHVTNSQFVTIKNSRIMTGDDCISIVSGSNNIRAHDITCGPGHGISIGSLGAKNSEAIVSNVDVDTARFSGTTNGVRIKTWQGGKGYAKNIVFKNIIMHNVSNPIIIDQNYCDQKEPCSQQAKAVQVSNVIYKNIKGTSASAVAVKFDCSKTLSCKGIVLENVNLVYNGKGSTEASCENVKFRNNGIVSPQCNT